MRNDSFDDGSLAEWGLRFRGFVRGDLSASGALEVTDAILLLRYLFMAEDVACPEAGDYDDDGSLSVTDATTSVPPGTVGEESTIVATAGARTESVPRMTGRSPIATCRNHVPMTPWPPRPNSPGPYTFEKRSMMASTSWALRK